MTERLALETDEAIVAVIPKLGGSLAGFDLKAGTDRLPVFRPWSGASESPRTFSLIPMVPWWARISGNGFHFGDVFYPIADNDPEDTHPLHGDGWQTPWEVTEQPAGRVALQLRSRAVPPFDYLARLVYALSGATLEISLSIQNLADRPLPYGMGLHPWFPRTPDVTLQAVTTGTWLVLPPILPSKVATDPLPPELDFSKPRRLPSAFVDSSFAGWDGHGRIEWPSQRYAVTITADPAIRLCHVYAPDPKLPFFCFEQVTTLIDAVNIPGTPEETGNRILAPGEETSMWTRYAAERL